MLPVDFRAIVYHYCLVFSASETSGFRTIAHNRDVGGKDGGPHIAGVASDVVYDGSPPGPEADAWLAAHGVRRFPEGDHDHLQPDGWKNLPVRP